MSRFRILATATALVVATSGCSGSNSGTTSIKPSAFSTYSQDDDQEVGSRNNPINLGETFRAKDWEVKIVSVNTDATAQVLETDIYNSPPPSNEKYVLFSIEAIYMGDETGYPDSDLTFKVVGSKGNTFNDSCGYSADTFSQNGETFPGAAVSGDKCISVEADQISGATISVQGEYASKERTFVKVN